MTPNEQSKLNPTERMNDWIRRGGLLHGEAAVLFKKPISFYDLYLMEKGKVVPQSVLFPHEVA